MKQLIAGILCALLLLSSSPARADFKYSDTSKITGGSLKSMMKTVGIFSKQASQAMKPVNTTHYIKGDRMRTDGADGRIQIIDLAGRRIIDLDPQTHTYTEITFDEMKAAMQKAQDQLQQKQAEAQQKPDNNSKSKDPKANINAKINVTPGTQSRQIQGLTANEMKIQVDMEIQAQNDSPSAAQPGGPVAGTISTSIDSWVAPEVPGYNEIAAFYQRMAKEINWVPPSSIRVDPRVSQSMDELQKNQAAYKGLPLLQYLSMTMVAQDGSSPAAADSANNSAANTNASRNSDAPTSASDAMVKGLGGLFSKKKKKDDADAQQSSSQNPPPPSTPGSLMEMTIEVTSFSNAALDASLFEIPSGFTRVQQNPDQILKQNKP
jgi:hypothetical protein